MVAKVKKSLAKIKAKVTFGNQILKEKIFTFHNDQTSYDLWSNILAN